MIDYTEQKIIAHCKTVGDVMSALRTLQPSLPVHSLEFGETIDCVNIFYAEDSQKDSAIIIF